MPNIILRQYTKNILPNERNKNRLDELQEVIEGKLNEGQDIETILSPLNEEDKDLVNKIIIKNEFKSMSAYAKFIGVTAESVRRRLLKIRYRIQKDINRNRDPKEIEEMVEHIKMIQTQPKPLKVNPNWIVDYDERYQFNRNMEHELTQKIEDIMNKGAELGYTLKQLIHYIKRKEYRVLQELLLETTDYYRDHTHRLLREGSEDMKDLLITIAMKICLSIADDFIPKFKNQAEVGGYIEDAGWYSGRFLDANTIIYDMFYEWFYHSDITKTKNLMCITSSLADQLDMEDK